MIVFENRDYRIDHHPNIGTRVTFALDWKEKRDNRICLSNIGWYEYKNDAIRAMNDHAELLRRLDGDPQHAGDMKPFVVLVSEFVRPSLEIETVHLPDGKIGPGMSYWTAVYFESIAARNELVGRHDIIRLQWVDNPKEVWEFYNAMVMVRRAKKNCYTMAYGGVSRIS